MEGRINGTDGQPGENRNAWSLDGLAMPCRWRARSRTTRSMPALGRGGRGDLRTATSVTESGSGRVGRGRSCPGSHATVDGRRGGIRDLLLAGWYGMPPSCSQTESVDGML